MSKRIFIIYSVTDGVEKHHATISSWSSRLLAAKGKKIHAAMKAENQADYIRCRDVLGGLRFEYNLKTGRKTA